MSSNNVHPAIEVRAATTGRSENPEAFQLYLQAKFHGERFTQADTDRAIELFKRAIAIDPIKVRRRAWPTGSAFRRRL